MPASVLLAGPADAGIQPPDDRGGDRGDDRDFSVWEAELAATGVQVCAHPIRLAGSIAHANTETGEVREVYSTADAPLGVLLKGCGNRRAAVCPACSQVYRRDARQLILAGLVGGKGVPETVSEHPRVFATFTAPSFGEVHSRVVLRDRLGQVRYDRDGAELVQPCHPRNNAEVCPHGVRLDCRLRHRADDRRVGQPLCRRCYDYQGHVLWNAVAGKLWSRTTEHLRRALAYLTGLTLKALKAQVKLEYARVAEYQGRGVVHFHAVIRIDRTTTAGTVQPPPEPFTVDLLSQALALVVAGGELPDRKRAFHAVTFPVPGSLRARWGAQLDMRRSPTARWSAT